MMLQKEELRYFISKIEKKYNFFIQREMAKFRVSKKVGNSEFHEVINTKENLPENITRIDFIVKNDLRYCTMVAKLRLEKNNDMYSLIKPNNKKPSTILSGLVLDVVLEEALVVYEKGINNLECKEYKIKTNLLNF
jgi:hypothetical protein